MSSSKDYTLAAPAIVINNNVNDKDDKLMTRKHYAIELWARDLNKLPRIKEGIEAETIVCGVQLEKIKEN